MARFWYDIWVYRRPHNRPDFGALVYIEAGGDHAQGTTDSDGHVELFLDLSTRLPASIWIRRHDMRQTVEAGARNTVFTS